MQTIANPNVRPEAAYLGAGDQILSEIAEEDSVSMVSDRPKRLG